MRRLIVASCNNEKKKKPPDEAISHTLGHWRIAIENTDKNTYLVIPMPDLAGLKSDITTASRSRKACFKKKRS